MPNPVTNHNHHIRRRRPQPVPVGKLWETLFVTGFWLSCTSPLLAYGMATYFLDNFFPRCLSWRQTSKKELEDTDRKILDGIPAVKERQFVSVGEESLWSVICNPEGRGTPMLMIHGMGGGVGLWAMNLDELAQDRPVYAFDLLGFGRSSHPTFRDSAEEVENQFVESIESYRKEMKLDKFILLGHSLGGFLSAAYCLRHPQHVKHLVLVDPWGMDRRPPEGSGRQMPFFIKMAMPVINFFNPMSILRAIGPFGPKLVKIYRPGLAGTFSEKLGCPNLFHDYIYHCNAQSPSGEIAFKNMTMHVGWAKQPMMERMLDIHPDLPITFIYGAKSWIDRKSGWKVKHARKGYVDVQILRGAGHHVYADRYNVFNTLVRSIAESVDEGHLPQLDPALLDRIHSNPTAANLLEQHSPDESDFQRPLGHLDENPAESNVDFAVESGSEEDSDDSDPGEGAASSSGDSVRQAERSTASSSGDSDRQAEKSTASSSEGSDRQTERSTASSSEGSDRQTGRSAASSDEPE